MVQVRIASPAARSRASAGFCEVGLVVRNEGRAGGSGVRQAREFGPAVVRQAPVGVVERAGGQAARHAGRGLGERRDRMRVERHHRHRARVAGEKRRHARLQRSDLRPERAGLVLHLDQQRRATGDEGEDLRQRRDGLPRRRSDGSRRASVRCAPRSAPARRSTGAAPRHGTPSPRRRRSTAGRSRRRSRPRPPPRPRRGCSPTTPEARACSPRCASGRRRNPDGSSVKREDPLDLHRDPERERARAHSRAGVPALRRRRAPPGNPRRR